MGDEDCKKPSTCRIEGYQSLDRIASYLRDKLPVEATLPSECIRHPTSGDDAGLSSENCVHVDSFLYGAYYYSDASKIVGIEINKDFCKLQEDTVAKFKLGSRVKIVLGNMCAQTELLASADVLVLNNVFSWLMPEQLQAKMWQCLHRVIRPGCLLVTIPALETSLGSLKTGIKID